MASGEERVARTQGDKYPPTLPGRQVLFYLAPQKNLHCEFWILHATSGSSAQRQQRV